MMTEQAKFDLLRRLDELERTRTLAHGDNLARVLRGYIELMGQKQAKAKAKPVPVVDNRGGA